MKKLFSIEGKDTVLEVFEDYCTLSSKKNFWSGVRGKLGGTELRYSQLTAVQFKPASLFMHEYILLEYPGCPNDGNIYLRDNSFTFEKKHDKDGQCEKAVEYIRKRIAECKSGGTPNYSAADELKKYKELLDSGAITQEEYDMKKKELLGL